MRVENVLQEGISIINLNCYRIVKRFIGYEGANIHTNSYGKLERIVFEDQDYLDG